MGIRRLRLEIRRLLLEIRRLLLEGVPILYRHRVHLVVRRFLVRRLRLLLRAGLQLGLQSLGRLQSFLGLLRQGILLQRGIQLRFRQWDGCSNRA